ncbi:MAG: Rieske 2Fe-2S domain-containing protein [Candidatus Lustribacter sp.]|jgi:phthalate 4,5-dioxygenase oxygenase subunit
MLSAAENELLTRVEGTAPMGQLFRCYWLPMLLSEEIAEPDGAPAAITVLGQELVAFRDTNGRVGVLNAGCPHRLSSLVLGRNEECGIRCVYHGWKFDVDGNCTDMPTEPDDRGFKDRLKAVAYPVREAAGMVWAYLGPREHEPPFPAFPWTAYPGNQVGVAKSGYRTNYLQAVEGAIDSAHSWYLHSGSSRDWDKRFELSSDASPRLEAEDTPYGFRYAATRVPNVDPETTKYTRVTIFNVPSTSTIPPPLDPNLPAHTSIFVPIDDENTMLFDVYHSQNGTPVDPLALRRRLKVEPGVDLDEDWFFRGGRKNRWNQNRAAMKTGSYTGIAGFQNQDTAAVESMGAISDRTQEHLGQSDVAIIRMRRRLAEAVKSFQAGNTPPGLDGSTDYALIRSAQSVIPKDMPWQEMVPSTSVGATAAR